MSVGNLTLAALPDSVEIEQLPESLRSLHAFWDRCRAGRVMPLRRDIDVLDLRPWLGHLMLIDVKEPLKANDAVPITLRVEQPDGSVQEIEVQAEVRPLGGGAQGHGDHGEAHGHGHGHGHGDAHGHGHGHGDTHGHHN